MGDIIMYRMGDIIMYITGDIIMYGMGDIIMYICISDWPGELGRYHNVYI